MSLKKEKFFKRLAEVLGVTQRNMDAALDFIEKEESEKNVVEKVIDHVAQDGLNASTTPLTDEESDDQQHADEEAEGEARHQQVIQEGQVTNDEL